MCPQKADLNIQFGEFQSAGIKNSQTAYFSGIVGTDAAVAKRRDSKLYRRRRAMPTLRGKMQYFP